MSTWLWVALGSALGGVGRYGCGIAAAGLWGTAFPWGTLIVNIAGSFVIGFAGSLTHADGHLLLTPDQRAFVLVGLCGGFTTFSSFSLQTMALMQSGEWLPAGANVVGSVLLCLVAVWLGHLAATSLGVRGG